MSTTIFMPQPRPGSGPRPPRTAAPKPTPKPSPKPAPWAALQPDPAGASAAAAPPVQPARTDACHSPDPHTARRDLLERGAAEMLRARRYGRPFALICLAGATDDEGLDEAMRDVLEGATRAGADIVVRTGPCAFVCLLPETNLSGAMHLAARIQRTLQAMPLANGSQTSDPVTGGRGVAARAGFAALAATDGSFATMLRRAQAMVKGRGAG